MYIWRWTSNMLALLFGERPRARREYIFIDMQFYMVFLDASSRLYKRVCLSLCPLVRPSITRYFRLWRSMEGGEEGGGEEGGSRWVGGGSGESG